MTNPSNVGQQPNLEPQPNSNAAVQDLQIQVAHGDAAGILPNMPLVNVNNIIQLCQQMQLEIQQMQLELEIQQSRNELRTEQRLLPIRLYNCSDREYAPIRYPEGLAPHPALPACRYDIANLTSTPAGSTTSSVLGADIRQHLNVGPLQPIWVCPCSGEIPWECPCLENTTRYVTAMLTRLETRPVITTRSRAIA